MTALFAAVFAALYVGHEVADHWVQRNGEALGKSAPGWPGRAACASHVLMLTLTLAVFLFAAVIVTGARISSFALVGGLAVNGVSHYWADRRTTLRGLARLAGKGEFWDLGAPRPRPRRQRDHRNRRVFPGSELPYGDAVRLRTDHRGRFPVSTQLLENARDLYWRDRAACKGKDPGLFFPVPGVNGLEAKCICAACPVSGECLDDALETGERHGIRGGVALDGKSGRERRKIAAGRGLEAA